MIYESVLIWVVYTHSYKINSVIIQEEESDIIFYRFHHVAQKCISLFTENSCIFDDCWKISDLLEIRKRLLQYITSKILKKRFLAICTVMFLTFVIIFRWRYLDNIIWIVLSKFYCVIRFERLLKALKRGLQNCKTI